MIAHTESKQDERARIEAAIERFAMRGGQIKTVCMGERGQRKLPQPVVIPAQTDNTQHA